MSELTWTCHVCGEERPDDKISVMHVPPPSRLVGVIELAVNVRHCNDRPACIEGARHVNFFYL